MSEEGLSFGGGRGTLRDWFQFKFIVNNFVTFKITVFGHGIKYRKQVCQNSEVNHDGD